MKIINIPTKNGISTMCILLFTLAGLVMLHLLLEMVWMAILLVILHLFLWLYLAKHHMAVVFRRLKWVSYPTLLLGAFTLGISLQFLFIGIAHIPSSSMEPTLKCGDVVWFSKLRYGAKLPASPLEVPWVNVLFWLTSGKKANSSCDWGYHRLRGYSQPKRNDIVIFNPPHSPDTYIKRCVAIPGDTLQIVNDSVFINGVFIAEPYAKHTKPAISNQNSKTINLIVPYEGFNIAASNGSWGTYSQLIQQPERESLSYNTTDSSHTFQQDYYFMLGDNRCNSFDSRCFGPVPESAIIGRAILVIYSKCRKSRLLKRID